MLGRSVNLTTLFLCRLRPLKRLTSTSCTYFHQKLTTAPLESAEGVALTANTDYSYYLLLDSVCVGWGERGVYFKPAVNQPLPNTILVGGRYFKPKVK